MSTRMLMKAKRGRIVALLRWSSGERGVKIKKSRPNIFSEDPADAAPSNIIMFRHTPAMHEKEFRKAS